MLLVAYKSLWKLFPTQRVLTFQCVPCVKIKNINQKSCEGDYSFEFFLLHRPHIEITNWKVPLIDQSGFRAADEHNEKGVWIAFGPAPYFFRHYIKFRAGLPVMVIVIPHNVELCKQYFLQKCLLLIRKLCNWLSIIAFMEKTTVGIKICKKGENINCYCK